jgi:hypothetical protein
VAQDRVQRLACVEYGNEPSSSITDGEFPDLLSNRHLLKKDLLHGVRNAWIKMNYKRYCQQKFQFRGGNVS